MMTRTAFSNTSTCGYLERDASKIQPMRHRTTHERQFKMEPFGLVSSKARGNKGQGSPAKAHTHNSTQFGFVFMAGDLNPLVPKPEMVPSLNLVQIQTGGEYLNPVHFQTAYILLRLGKKWI